ncbi:unnamed protein product [Cylindrotheca closterium]|uniref:EF-hand domain-containing protein n=1 Tax=Cylindrotheca closterium TaxID=2856 RepID=A0AAD2CXF2_9STRA|nr:unnamed protein product [Cylindrotheca closterium]
MQDDTVNEDTPLVAEDGTFTYNRSVSTYLDEAIGSERQHEIEKVWPAAHLIRDAILGEIDEPYDGWYDPHSNPANKMKNKCSLICIRAESRINGLIAVTMWTLILISFFEPPHWCRVLGLDTDHRYGSCGAVLEATDPSDESISYYPNFGLMMLTEHQAHTLQLICVLILVSRILIRIGRNGFEMWRFFHPEIRYANSLRLLSLILLCFKGTVMFHPFLRLLLLGSYLKDCQKEIVSLVKLIPDVVSIMVIVGAITAFYSVVGVLLFDVSEQGQRDFPNWIEGVWTLWICVTTANYPDVMMPSYNKSRFSGIYFVSFMVIVFFLLMNMVLGSVVEHYDLVMENRKKKMDQMLHQDLARAFELMDPNGTGVVTQDTILALFVILNADFLDIRRLSDEETVKLFNSLDVDHSNEINAEEFQEFGKAFAALAAEPDYTTMVQKRFPEIYASDEWQKVSAFVRSRKFEMIIECLLVLNAVVVVIQSYPELAGEYIANDTAGYNGEFNIWEYFESVFTVAYTVEATIKILVDGWTKYSESPRNVFDFTITVSVLAASIYVYYPNDYDDNRLITFVVLLRVLRLGRLLMAFPAFQDITAVALEIIPKSKSVLQLLFFVTYFFSALAVILYGGLITRDPENRLSELLLDTDFASNEYWGNNFNDMMSAMNVMFNLIVVNNWTTCEGGYEAVTEGKMVRLFFFSFHIVGVVLTNNIVMAFVINSFLSHLRAKKTGPESNQDESLKQ